MDVSLPAQPRSDRGVSAQEDWDPLHTKSLPDRHWTTSNLGEAMPGVLTPLSWTLWSKPIERSPRESTYRMGVLTRRERLVPEAARDRFIGIFYGRPAVQIELMAMLGDRMPGTTGEEAVRSLVARVPEDMVFRPTRRRYPIVAWRFPVTFMRVPGQLRNLKQEQDAWYRASLARAPKLDRPATLALFGDAAARFSDAMAMQAVSLLSTVQPLYDALGRLVERAGCGDLSLLSGASGGAEMELVSDLWKASREQIAVEDVVRVHGFHGPGEGELSSRVWREDDRPVRALVSQYAGRADEDDPELLERRRRVARQACEREVLAALPAIQRPGARLLMRLALERIPLRGVAKRSFLQALDIARLCARRLGQDLVSRGALDDADGVFYLTVEELTGDLPIHPRQLIVKRRNRREEYMELTIPSEWKGDPDPVAAEPAEPDEDHDTRLTVRGVGASSGVVEGFARVLASPDFDVVQPDEVLVAPTTDPSWSSVMFVSAALVVDIGGALSHAAVVARELGIPCVVNTRTGTRELRTGDRVRVDGAAGSVEVLERSNRDSG